LRVRGAPAIGITAAYGVVLGVQNLDDSKTLRERVHQVAAYLRTSRPTAVNLFWALERMERATGEPCGVNRERLLQEAHAILAEDLAMCRAIGEIGAGLIRDGMGVLTHCNAGALATSDYGTALAAMFRAHEQGRRFCAYVDETRPLLQGARLTAWELMQRGVAATLICDSMAARVMQEGRVQVVMVGADRIAANGDTANKIGTYGLALLAKAHGIPFYVAAPSSTFDLSLPEGRRIPIEERDPREVTHPCGHQAAPDGIRVYNPAFDVTPAHLIAGIITERGLIQPVEEAKIRSCLGEQAG
jgi:methylthioribose-1-phosphate isomerase